MSFRFAPLVAAPVLLLLFVVAIASCGGGGGCSGAFNSAGVFVSGACPNATISPGFELEAIIVGAGTPTQPSPTPSPTSKPTSTTTPTVTPHPEATDTATFIDGAINFNAQGVNVKGTHTIIEDITNSPAVVWTSTNPSALLGPGPNQIGGTYTGSGVGCACIFASSAGIQSNQVGVQVFASPTSTAFSCPECPTPSATPTASPAAEASAAAILENTLAGAGPHGVLQWSYDAGARLKGPIVPSGDGKVYFIGGNSILRALDAHGNELYDRPSGGLAPAVAPDGTVFVAGPTGFFYRLKRNGTAAWTLRLGAGSGALAASTDLVFATVGDQVVAISQLGQLAWSVSTGAVSAGASLGDGVIVSTSDAQVIALDRDGAILWRFAPPGGVAGSLAIAQDAVLIGTGDGTLMALDSSSGKVLWQVDTGVPIVAGPVSGPNGTIYFGSDLLHALTADGASAWALSPPPAENALVALAGGGVFYSSNEQSALALDADGGAVWGTRSLGAVDRVAASPAGMLYVASAKGRVFAIK